MKLTISHNKNKRESASPLVDSQAQDLANWLREARRAVVFTGAGVSTESGIPDFRSPGGVWTQRKPVLFQDYCSDPEARIEYWRQRALTHPLLLAARPNGAHRAFAEWESRGWVRGVVTQNIDGLHQAAGSRTVLELHGTALEVACLDCGARYKSEEMLRRFESSARVPVCDACGGLTKHATVSFGQSLPVEIIRQAINWARGSDVFIAAGSSLVVTPAAELPALAKQCGARLAILNREPTSLDASADLVIRAGIGDVIARVNDCLVALAAEGGGARSQVAAARRPIGATIAEDRPPTRMNPE